MVNRPALEMGALFRYNAAFPGLIEMMHSRIARP